MKPKEFTSIFLLLAIAALSACGGGGSTSSSSVADPNAPATVALSASKDKALANAGDGVVVNADVRKAGGEAVADGTIVTFTIRNGGTLSASLAATLGGVASVTVTRAPIADSNVQAVPVTCSVGGVSGTREVKFINAPTEAVVFISFKQPVTDLAALSFKLKNTAGASFNNSAQPVMAVNGAVGTLVVGNFNAATNSTSIGLVSGSINGFNTGTTPVIRATYAVTAGATLPEFSIDETPAGFSATNGSGAATSPAVSAADMNVSVVFDTEI